MWAVKHFRHFLYGHTCTHVQCKCKVYTDHEAWKSLMNTPGSWLDGVLLSKNYMYSVDLEIHVHYWTGKSNSNADALSRAPVEQNASNPFGMVATVSPYPTVLPVDDGEPLPISTRQAADPTLKPIIDYCTDGTLPPEEKKAQELVLSKSQYTLVDGVLYYVQKDGALRLIPPSSDRKKLYNEAYQGTYGGHLRDAKMYGALSQHYW